jgi:hypothetical protein
LEQEGDAALDWPQRWTEHGSRKSAGALANEQITQPDPVAVEPQGNQALWEKSGSRF